MHKENGFSLIETALILLVLGLIAVPYIQQYEHYLIERYTAKSRVAMSTVNNAITEFYELYDRYPCPAIPEIAIDESLHGVEQCPGRDMDGDATIMPLMAMDSCTDGYCRVGGRDADGDTNDDGVLIGIVPYATLGIPYQDALDGWKNRLSYVVTESLTDSGTFIATRGSIMVWKADGSTPLSYGDPGDPSANPKDQNGQATAHYAFFSHGDNGRGAYNIDGERIGDICDNTSFTGAEIAAASKDKNEIENCDGDYEFTWESEAYSLVDGFDYYDDLFEFRDGIPSGGTWNFSGFQTDVFTNFGGNLGIGTPDPAFAVDVNGNVRAASLTRSSGYCEDNGTGCFTADDIGGSGMNCGSNPMAGIDSSTGVCDVSVPVGNITGECSSGEYVTGIDATGAVICEPI